MRMWVRSLAFLSGLRIQCCWNLCCRSQILPQIWRGCGISWQLQLQFSSYPGNLHIATSMALKTGKCSQIGEAMMNKKSSFVLPDLIFFFFCFLGPHIQHMKVPRLGVKLDLQLLTYTTAVATQDLSPTCDLYHTGYLTHWAKPEIRPVSLWIPVGFITAEPQWELPGAVMNTLCKNFPSRASEIFKAHPPVQRW